MLESRHTFHNKGTQIQLCMLNTACQQHLIDLEVSELVLPGVVPGQPVDVRIDAGVRQAGLANVAATVLQLLGLDAPEGYAPSLLE